MSPLNSGERLKAPWVSCFIMSFKWQGTHFCNKH